MVGRGGSASPGAWTTPTALERSGQGERNRALILDVKNWATPDCNTSSYSNGLMGPNIREQASQWLTPNVPNGGRSVSAELVASKGTTPDGEKRTVGLESQTKHWSSPRASDGKNGGPNQRGSKGDLMLPSMAAQWPTPSASVANDGESPETWHARAAKLKLKHGNGNGAGLLLTVASVQWPTPNAHDGRRPGADLTSTQGMNLSRDAATWPTPAQRDYRSPNSQSLEARGGGMKGEQLANFVEHHFSPPALPMEAGPASSPNSPGSAQPLTQMVSDTPKASSRRLNPYFGEHLMGWPLGLTSTTEPPVLSASEMESFRFRLASHLSFLLGEPGCSLDQSN